MFRWTLMIYVVFACGIALAQKQKQEQELGLGSIETLQIDNPIYLPLKMDPAKTYDEYLRQVLLHSQSVVNSSFAKSLRERLPEGYRPTFDLCLSQVGEKIRSGLWPLQGAAHLCAAAGSRWLDGLNFQAVPNAKGQFVLTIGNRKTPLTQEVSSAEKRIDFGVHAKIQNPCRLQDGLGLGLIPYDKSLPAGIPDSQRSALIKASGKEQGSVSVLWQDLQNSKGVSEGAKELRQRGLDPQLARVALLFNPIMQAEVVCVACPADYISNGHDDCIKGACGLLSGCPPTKCDPSYQVKYQDQCVLSCMGQCREAETDLQKLKDEFQRFKNRPQGTSPSSMISDSAWTKEMDQRFRGLMEAVLLDFKSRLDLGMAKCQKEPHILHCQTVDIDPGDIQFRLVQAVTASSAGKRCPAGQIQAQGKCKSPTCLSCTAARRFPYYGVPFLNGCTEDETYQALLSVQEFRASRPSWEDACDGSQCQAAPVDEEDLHAALTSMGVRCLRTLNTEKPQPPSQGTQE